MSIRMVPVAATFHKMQRIVRDMNRKLGKDVELQLSGEETEVDKSIIDTLSDPLMHLIRMPSTTASNHRTNGSCR
jgi:two-component system chemotaxis sensor kinase CheA